MLFCLPARPARFIGFFLATALSATSAANTTQDRPVDPASVSSETISDATPVSAATSAADAVAAENVDLSKPVAPQQASEPKPEPKLEVAPEAEPQPEPASTPTATSDTAPASKTPTPEPAETSSASGNTNDNSNDNSSNKAAPEKPTPQPEKPFTLLGKIILPGTTTRLMWNTHQQSEGLTSPTPVLVAHGKQPGPKLCLTAAVHGDELIGIEVVRRVLYDINAEDLKGSVIGVPIVNLQGFRRSSRYLADRRDLNRFFPGTERGSSASRIAHSFFSDVISHCDFLVDLHTGSFYRTNLPQIRADLNNADVLRLTQAFDSIVVLHGQGAKGTLRRAAVTAGIPAVTLEAGGPMELNEDYVKQGTKSVNTLLDKLGMLNKLSFWDTPSPAYYRSVWVRVNQGGILFSDVKLGAKVRKGDALGRVTDPITNIGAVIHSPANGRIIGLAVNQVVLPGFAAYHIGIDSDAEQSKALPDDDIDGNEDLLDDASEEEEE